MARDLIVDGELVLYGPVGGSFWDDDGFTATDVLQALAQLDGDITVRLNSGGGIAWDGIAIYNALKARGDSVTIIIDGVAASAASVIAMAGDDVVMRTGALMMIHNASTITWGTADEHAQSIELLRKLDGQIAAVYAERTGLDLAEIHALMDAETWMDGAEAIEKGFAGETDAEKAAKASAFDYRLYAHAPKPLQSIARKLKAPIGSPPGTPLNSAATPARAGSVSGGAPGAKRKDSTMTNQTPPAPPPANDNAAAEATKADRARIAGILNHAEAQGREDLAKHLALETDMSADAAAVILAKAAKASSAAPQTLEETPRAHAQRRAAAGGLASPQAGNERPAGKGDLAPLAAAVARTNKRR